MRFTYTRRFALIGLVLLEQGLSCGGVDAKFINI